MPKEKPVLKESTYKNLVTRCANQSEEITQRFRKIMEDYSGGNYPKNVASLIENINNLYHSAYKASVNSFTEDSSKVKDALKEVSSARRALKKDPESDELKANLENATKAFDESLAQQSSSIRRSADVLTTSIKNLKAAMDELETVVENIKNTEDGTNKDTDGPGTSVVLYDPKPLQIDTSETSLVWVNPKEIIPEEDEVIAGDNGIIPVDVSRDENPQKDDESVTEDTHEDVGIIPVEAVEILDEKTDEEKTDEEKTDEEKADEEKADEKTDDKTEDDGTGDGNTGGGDTNPQTTETEDKEEPHQTEPKQPEPKQDEKSGDKKKKDDKEKNVPNSNDNKDKGDKGSDEKPKQVPIVTSSLFFMIAVACFFLLLAGVTAPVVAPLLLGSSIMATFGSSMGTLYYTEKSSSKNKSKDKKEKDKDKAKTKGKEKDKDQTAEKDKDQDQTRTQETSHDSTTHEETEEHEDHQSAEPSTVVGTRIISDEQADKLRNSIEQEQEMRTNPEKVEEYRGALNEVAQATQQIVPEGTSVSDFAEEHKELAQRCVDFQVRYQVFQAAEKALDDAQKELADASADFEEKDSKKNQQRVEEANAKVEEAKKAYDEASAPLIESVDKLAEASKKYERVQEQQSDARTEEQPQTGIATFAQLREQDATTEQDTTAEQQPLPKKPEQIGTTALDNTQSQAANDAIIQRIHEELGKLKGKGTNKSIDDFFELNTILTELIVGLKEPLNKDQRDIAETVYKLNQSFAKLNELATEVLDVRSQIDSLVEQNKDGSNDDKIKELQEKQNELSEKGTKEAQNNAIPTITTLDEKTTAYLAKERQNEATGKSDEPTGNPNELIEKPNEAVEKPNETTDREA